MNKKACGGLWFFYEDRLKEQVQEELDKSNESCELGCTCRNTDKEAKVKQNIKTASKNLNWYQSSKDNNKS